MPGERVLLVDDEPSITELVRLYLDREGYTTHIARDGEAALASVSSLAPDLMILDVMLPKIDGFEVCRQLRAANHSIPIIMLTARDEDVDKIVGLELGADDYLTKPFNPRELVARVKAILRREERRAHAADPAPIELGRARIDPTARELSIDGRRIDLRTQEFELLLTFARHKGTVLSRDRLLQLAWGYDFYGQTRTVDVHVAQLRKKLAGSGLRIETVTGIGYKLTLA